MWKPWLMSDAPRNLPVPDALAGIREQIKALETQEAELKRILLTDPSARTGADWIAEVKEIETTRVDIKELRAMHKDLVEEYTFPTKVTRVELSAITEDGEIVSARRMRSAAKSGDTQ
jgi:predicted phage-related endonuclease